MKKTLLALFLLAIFIFLSFNKHSKDNYKGYHSVIWADGAGYYVYNPMWFIYGNNSENFPKDIIEKTGNGFSFDSVSKKVIVKYTSGIAFLQMPFFLTAHFLASPLGFPSDGFIKIYFGGIMIAACLYGLLGLIFSFMFLRHYFSGWHSFITVAVFFLATNLYYYMIDASGMLHVYAFFLFSAIAYLTVKIYEQPSFRNIFFLILCFALAVLIRPTNILLIIFILFFGMKNFRERVFFFIKNFF